MNYGGKMKPSKTVIVSTKQIDFWQNEINKLQEQLKEANDIIKQYAEKTMMGYPKNDGTYILQNGTIIDEKKVVISTTILDPRPANDYLKKWGVK